MVLVYSDNKNLMLELLNKGSELAKELNKSLTAVMNILLIVMILFLSHRIIFISLKLKSVQILLKALSRRTVLK